MKFKQKNQFLIRVRENRTTHEINDLAIFRQAATMPNSSALFLTDSDIFVAQL